MRNPPRISVFRSAWVFWVGAVAALAACGEGDPPSALPSASATAGAAGAGSATSVDAGAPAAAAGSGSSAGSGGAPAASEADAGVSAPPGACAPGETQECTFDLLCSGVQTCGDSGTFGSCECASTPLDGVALVGSRCASDADCAGGGTCLRAESNDYIGQGGPPGGYCSFPCNLEADDCTSHDTLSFCAPAGPEGAGYCIRTCQSLDPEPGEAKCLNRDDLVCVSAAADGIEQFNGQRQAGYCRPFCGNDADCPEGRVCHAQGHICTDAQIGGAPVGASCSLSSECSGYECEDLNAQNVGVCTERCVLGALNGCGYPRDTSSRGAACLTPLVAFGRFTEGAGDLGLCRELCDVAEECEQAGGGWLCQPLSPEAAEFFGKTGACVPPS